MELQIDLSGPRVRRALEGELRRAVQAGRLVAGGRLPSARTLAKDLGIGRNSVADAYGQLVAEGWLVARHGGGTWVAEGVGVEPAAVARPVVDERPVRFDLRPGVPDLGGFPRTAWLAAGRRALAVAADASFGYGDPRGLLILREAPAGYLARTRRVALSPERIVVCCGFAHGLDLLSAALRGRGASTVAVEAYGHGLHRDIIEANGLVTAPLAVDDRGADVAHLDAEGAALVTPAHQFPLGVVLHPARRRRLAELIGSTALDRHVRRARHGYRRRRDRLVAALAATSDAVEVSGIAAGMHALVHLRRGDEADVVARAAAAGLALDGLRHFTHYPGHERGPALVIGYGTPPDHAYSAALARLTSTLAATAPSSAGMGGPPRDR